MRVIENGNGSWEVKTNRNDLTTSPGFPDRLNGKTLRYLRDVGPHPTKRLPRSG